MEGSSPLRSRARGLADFLTVGVWRVEMENCSRFARLAVGALKILILAARALPDERMHLRAAGLTFYSLLSIVPVLAMLFGLAKGFGLVRVLEKELLARGEGQEEIVARMIGFAHNLLETTQGGVVAGVGVLVLFWSVVMVFGSVEKGFNELWGVDRERSLLRKATDYLSLSLLCTVLLAVSGTLTVLITTEVTFALNRIRMLETVGPVILFGLRILPLVAIWVLFTLLYAVIPNTAVRPSTAALGGILAGTAFQIFQRIYIQFQVGVAKYNAIYGSFAALPLFLVWLQVSWLIVLMGAFVSFACQNLEHLSMDRSSRGVSPFQRRILALMATNLVVKHFCSVGGGLTEKSIALGLRLPVSYLRPLLGDLVGAGVLAEVSNPEAAEASYQPGLDPEKLTLQHVIQRMDEKGADAFHPLQSETWKKLADSMETFQSVVNASPANVLLKNI